MAPIGVDKELFHRRLQRLYAEWKVSFIIIVDIICLARLKGLYNMTKHVDGARLSLLKCQETVIVISELLYGFVGKRNLRMNFCISEGNRRLEQD